MISNKPLKLGIVGGLGAHAGADILNRLVQRTPIKSEDDHREIIFEQHPLREPHSPAGNEYVPTSRKFYVYETLFRMQENGCDAALLPCFITHTFLDELQTELNIRLISMMDAIRLHLTSLVGHKSTIGVLATPYVRQSEIFEQMLGCDHQVIYPSDQVENAMMNAIYGENGLKTGNRHPSLITSVVGACQELIDKGVDLIIPGLTEVPLLMDAFQFPDSVPILNTAEIYADHALRETRGITDDPFKIGVVGGVGPAATADFLEKIVAETNAECDQDHIKVLIEQNPQIPDRTENLMRNGKDPTIALFSTCRKLERGGSNFIAIPCNTAHAYLERLQRHLNIPVISMLDTTADHIAQNMKGVELVGVLATDGTVDVGLYQTALKNVNLETILPDTKHQALVMDAIFGPHGVKAGHTTGKCVEQFAQAVIHLKERGAQCVVVGCTELPLIADNLDLDDTPPFVDPTRILAQRCVELALASG